MSRCKERTISGPTNNGTPAPKHTSQMLHALNLSPARNAAHIAFTLATVVALSQPKCPRMFALFAASLAVDAVRVGKTRMRVILLDR